MSILRTVKYVGRRIKSWILPIRFGNKPRNLSINYPRSIRNPKRIFIGDGVHLGPNCTLKSITGTGSLMTRDDGRHIEQRFDSRIVIGNRVSATAGLHIAAHEQITIEDDVMLASNVFMSDALHGYERIDLPYKYQGMVRVAPIVIKRGSWIGQNVVIMPGVSVGEMAIVGANSVVTRDVPDRSIAVGSPARVIRRWDESAGGWVSVPPETAKKERSGSGGNGCGEKHVIQSGQ